MLALVMTVAPASTLAGTCSPFEAASAILIVTHTERIWHNEGCDRAVLQEFDELVVRAEDDEIDLVSGFVRLLLDQRLGRPFRHDRTNTPRSSG